MKQYIICEMSDCERVVGAHGAKGLCPLHYRRYRVHGDPGYTKHHRICQVADCDRYKQTKAGYCTKHYKRYSKGYDPQLPSKMDRRQHINRRDHCLIPLGVVAKDGYAIVDTADSWIDKYQWSKNNSGYAQANVNGKTTLMHHVILGTPISPMVTDHINRNKVDNRRVNLRHITERENALNKRYAQA